VAFGNDTFGVTGYNNNSHYHMTGRIERRHLENRRSVTTEAKWSVNPFSPHVARFMGRDLWPAGSFAREANLKWGKESTREVLCSFAQKKKKKQKQEVNWVVH